MTLDEVMYERWSCFTLISDVRAPHQLLVLFSTSHYIVTTHFILTPDSSHLDPFEEI